ncbi:hypothetical protein COT12_02115 [Candidatus Berkelbacteria bacterium CG08_land_8_20_14_0_20_39_8]|uniref:Uncharacterized protein n=1 Tax=Candidatus Berkelbacteria bacterium CG08_land_8_20_14_0_20_39_8 TaxID=1974511 RepID=A0A2M6YC15_9BACT|nr:MAG: hypothetical protein COT12_02115 [Candidatus Berkelbacteria bacterium CG08_land_8_20_14_0_20_39_8]
MVEAKKKPSKKNVDGLTRRQLQESDQFFSDTDKNQNRFGTFWLFEIIILLVIFVGLVIVAVHVRRANINLGGIIETSGKSDSMLSDRLAIIYSFGISKLSFSEDEFISVSGADNPDFPLKDSQFSFTKDQMILAGKIADSWIPIPVKIKINPLVVAGKFSFIVAPDSLENIVVYGSRKEKIEQAFDKNINQVLKKENMIAKDILLSDGRIEMQVVKEKNEQ